MGINHIYPEEENVALSIRGYPIAIRLLGVKSLKTSYARNVAPRGKGMIVLGGNYVGTQKQSEMSCMRVYGCKP